MTVNPFDPLYRTLTRYIAGECSDQEHREIERWVAADPSRKEYVESLRQTWQLSGTLPAKLDARQAWTELSNRLHLVSQTPLLLSESKARSVRARFSFALRIAAVLVVLVGVSYIVVDKLIVPANNTQLVMREISTQKGQRIQFKFNDGTKVLLNAASVLRFPEHSRDGMREVYLSGEAYFEVTHLEGSKFVVHTEDAQVTVLGTQFSVRSYDEDAGVSVVVNSGKVAVRPSKQGAEMRESLLMAGQMSRVGKDGSLVSRSDVDLTRSLGWVNGRFVLENVTFKEALSELERWYNIQCSVAEQRVLKRRVTVSTNGENVTETLNVLSLLLDLTYEKSGNYVKFFTREVGKK